MTEKEALKLLSKPKFGENLHIIALKYLQELAEARELANKVVNFPNKAVMWQVLREFDLEKPCT